MLKLILKYFHWVSRKKLLKKFICMRHRTEIITDHHIFYLKKIHFDKICLVFFVLLGSTKKTNLLHF